MVSFPEACFVLTLAIHQAPKREAFVCLDASSRFVRDRQSRQLAARWQTKGADIHYARLPGESLSKRVEKANEKLLQRFLVCLLAPLAAGIIVLSGFYILYPKAPNSIWIPACSIAILGILILAAWALIDGVLDVAKLELGLNGERIVADFLRPLEREGWRVFHDVSARQNGKDFNLDHVTIGPTGVALIETKARSKGKTIEGREAHIVTFDGKKLEWPWGPSTSELKQLKQSSRRSQTLLIDIFGLEACVLGT